MCKGVNKVVMRSCREGQHFLPCHWKPACVPREADHSEFHPTPNRLRSCRFVLRGNTFFDVTVNFLFPHPLCQKRPNTLRNMSRLCPPNQRTSPPHHRRHCFDHLCAVSFFPENVGKYPENVIFVQPTRKEAR